MKKLLLFLIPCLLLSIDCELCLRDKRGKIVRNKVELRKFKKSTGFPGGRKGYIVDHNIPITCADDLALAVGKKDKKSIQIIQKNLDQTWNMRWQTKAEAKKKDKNERNRCIELGINKILPQNVEKLFRGIQ